MNWESLLLTLIAAIIPSTIMSLASFLQARETHKAVNSRMSELLELARAESASQATLVEKEAEHVRKGEAAVEAVKSMKEIS